VARGGRTIEVRLFKQKSSQAHDRKSRNDWLLNVRTMVLSLLINTLFAMRKLDSSE